MRRPKNYFHSILLENYMKLLKKRDDKVSKITVVRVSMRTSIFVSYSSGRVNDS